MPRLPPCLQSNSRIHSATPSSGSGFQPTRHISLLDSRSTLPKSYSLPQRDLLTLSTLSETLMTQNERPLRRIVTRKQRLQRLSLNQERKYLKSLTENRRCLVCNEDSIVERDELVCTSCGVVQSVLCYQSQEGNYRGRDDDWSDRGNGVFCSSGPCRQLVSSSGSTYLRYFHFNEILAGITLSGPRINNADMRIIAKYLPDRGGSGRLEKSDIQNVCREINSENGVKRFSRKYAEKWIQIVWRTTGHRPPEIHPNVIESLQRKFRIMVSHWDDCKHLLPGSKNSKRRQWPNYNETLYRMLKIEFPEVLKELEPWIPRLSEKKRAQLEPFYEKIISLVYGGMAQRREK